MRTITLLLFGLLVLSGPVRANGADDPADYGPAQIPEMALAERYIEALTSLNFNQLSRFYDRETLFEDKTAGKSLVGRRDILTFLRRVHSYTREYEFVPSHTFANGSLVVMIGSYYYQARGDLFGYPGETITFVLPGVTTLKVDMENQRISEHIDMFDYGAMKDQLKLQYH
ncbi:nuclear transport factor 2 family protein [Ferrimonas gelatinilytica]|uniref:Nuclear transport factor 2 family protein n=1 Tax=Ferrimonas gelatinilytica TaxID=1255257 RepID=A0ABP9S972_9GAMM